MTPPQASGLSVKLAINEQQMDFEPVLRAAVLLTLIELSAVFDPAFFWDLVGFALVAAKDVGCHLAVITRV